MEDFQQLMIYNDRKKNSQLDFLLSVDWVNLAAETLLYFAPALILIPVL